MVIKNFINSNLFSKLGNQFNLNKRYVLMRRYAYLREQLDEKLRQDERKQLEDKLQLNLNRNQYQKNDLLLKSVTSFKDLKEDVYKSFLNYEENQGVKWKRFHGLNKTLKGHRPGELTIFTGMSIDTF